MYDMFDYAIVIILEYIDNSRSDDKAKKST
jgi:hypothetical protein